MMSPLLDAFPRRTLQLRQPVGAWRSWLTALLMLVIAGSAVHFGANRLLPDLQADFLLRPVAQPIPARLVSGKCSSWLAVMQDCTLTLGLPTKDGEVQRVVHYAFALPHLGPFSITAMGDPARPELVTTDLGLAHLWNRAVTLVALAVVVLLMLAGVVIWLRRTGRQRRLVRALSGKALTPVPLRLRGSHGRSIWIVEDAEGRVGQWMVPRRARPFPLDPARDLILGLAAPDGAIRFPLDAKLNWVKLKAAERAQLRTLAPSGGSRLLRR